MVIMVITLLRTAEKNGKPIYKIKNIKLLDYMNMFPTYTGTIKGRKTTKVKNRKNTFVIMVIGSIISYHASYTDSANYLTWHFNFHAAVSWSENHVG